MSEMTNRARSVTAIPPSIGRFAEMPLAQARKRRVAGYARVSTDSDEQFTSYEAQIDYYTNYIKCRCDWTFVAVYTDEGITGTSTKHREGFKRMIADALAGKIDLIVTKSVSRFARNTVDSLTTVRQLKEKGVEIYFEKENIWTLDSKGELLITIMSSLAQEESRSISENCVWGQRKRFADGKVTVPFSKFLGYDRGSDGNLVVNEGQASTVRHIYGLFLRGLSPYAIAERLTADGVLTPGGKTRWHARTVRSILTNEKYKGDALLQKNYTVDFLTKRQKVNEGELPQYYVKQNHEPIIEPTVFDMVQREIARRHPGPDRHSGVCAFSGKVRCGECGGLYGPKVWHSNDPYRSVIWQCNHKFEGENRCQTPHFSEDELERLFILAVNELLSEKEEIRKNFISLRQTLYDTTALEAKRNGLQCELDEVTERVQECIRENASFALDQEEYDRRYNPLRERYESIKGNLEAVAAQIKAKMLRYKTTEQFIDDLMRQDVVVTFDPALWHSLVDHVTVYRREDVRFMFRDGTEIRASG